MCVLLNRNMFLYVFLETLKQLSGQSCGLLLLFFSFFFFTFSAWASSDFKLLVTFFNSSSRSPDLLNILRKRGKAEEEEEEKMVIGKAGGQERPKFQTLFKEHLLTQSKGWGTCKRRQGGLYGIGKWSVFSFLISFWSKRNSCETKSQI